MKPPFVTVRIARPLASRITAVGIAFSGISWKRSMIVTAWSTVVLHGSMDRHGEVYGE
jgi:hypothetical protein